MNRCQVVLVALPWAKLEHPSIQLGILQRLLEIDGIESRPLHLYLDFMELLAQQSELTSEDYSEIAAKYFMGDWIFSIPPFRHSTIDDGYLDFLRSQNEKESLIARIEVMRSLVPAFLDQAVGQILAFEPGVVGLTTTLGQNVPSLVLSRMLKLRRPEIKIVFGGANCDGDMGAALHRNFEWIDVVVRGEAEGIVEPLMRNLLKGDGVEPLPGLCYRRGTEQCVIPNSGRLAPLPSATAQVNYDDYFERLSAVSYRDSIASDISIPFESSRGCWWGVKQHCTFCGLNGANMGFRSRNGSEVADELCRLARKYQRLKFHAVDNIIDMKYFETLLPQFAALAYDFDIFYETKANLRKTHIEQFARSGITEIQPGIESLSTSILKLMRKGTTAVQNVRLLKWCAEYGVHVYWNIIYGIPGESPDEYRYMEQWVPFLVHLPPPNLIRLGLERFSPYFNRPLEYGIRVGGANRHYNFAYDLPQEELDKIAYSFEYSLSGGAAPDSYVSGLRKTIERWQSISMNGGPSTLTLLRGPDFTLIRDRRPGLDPADYRLDRIEGAIYAACASGATVSAVLERVRGVTAVSLGEESVIAFLSSLSKSGLLFEENGEYVSLALDIPKACVSPRADNDPGIKSGAIEAHRKW